MKRDKYSGKIINERYELIRLIDEGGMGAVYLGRDVILGRKAAVKFLHSELTSGGAAVKRFNREAQAASAVSHPNIISVFDVGMSEWGEPYLVMEYLSGETVGSLLKRKRRFDLPLAVGILEQAVRGLAAAHDQNIIHRDLKPENIFVVRITDGAPLIKLIDFGISKFVELDQPQLTRTGALLGTPSYMSPEQARGKGEFDHRADLYSMGVIFYLMLAGDHPFVGESYNDLIFNILTEEPRDPFTLNRDFPEEAAPIVSKLLEKSPDKRYADCKELLAALETLPAYEKRTEALRDLAENMLSDSFATGDLGAERDLPSESPVSDGLAATMLAKGSPSDGPDVLETKDVTPSGAKDNLADSKRLPGSNGAGEGKSTRHVDTPALETEGLSWDSIPSRVPPPRPRPPEKRSSLPVVLAVVGVFAVGFGVVMGIDMLFASDPTKPDVLNTLPSGDETPPLSTPAPDDSDATSAVPMLETEAESDSDLDTDTGTDTDTATDTDTGTETDTEHVVDTATLPSVSIPTTTAPTATLPIKGALPGKGPATVPSGGSSSSGAPSAGLSGIFGGKASTPPPTPEPSAPTPNASSGQKSGGLVLKDEPEDDGLPENPFEAAQQPIHSRTIDKLVNAKSTRIRNCYDMARISEPTIKGTLELIVGVAGDKVTVKVKSNELSSYLAACVSRVIKSIEPPPNNGTLVEILKEFEFRALP